MISQMMSKGEAAPVRCLPVLLLLDKSGSMDGDKIDALNQAVRDMLDAMKNEREGNFAVSAIQFGNNDDTRLLFPFTNVDNVQWSDLEAGGMTCLGQALEIAKGMIEDKEKMPSRSLRPTVIVVSDGEPNDEWEGPLDRFCHEGRSAKCFRWAMGIGCGKEGEDVLKSFISAEDLYFYAQDASKIGKFFEAVTLSTISRAKGATQTDISFGFSKSVSPEHLDDDDDIV